MASLSQKIRSISLPPGSHPATARVEEELGKFQSWESLGDFSSSGSIGVGLAGLERVYLCLEDVLSTGSTRHALTRVDCHVSDLLDKSVAILDVCGSTRDLVSYIKESVRELESAVRRSRKGDSGIVEAGIAESYANLRKKIKKDARRLVAELRRVENRTASEPLLDRDSRASAVVRAVREAHGSSVAVLRSVLTFISGPATAGQARWSVISRLVLKKASSPREAEPRPGSSNVNEFEYVGSALGSLCLKAGPNAEATRALQKLFEELENGIRGIEDGLGIMFRRLVKTRATLLNIISS